MASGQVDLAGAWYVHTIDFQTHGKPVVDIVQLSGAPGEREMCSKSFSIKSPAQWKGQSVGVTDLGSGTDDLTLLPRRSQPRQHLAVQPGRCGRRRHAGIEPRAWQGRMRNDDPTDGQRP